jgi:hypothetical protein
MNFLHAKTEIVLADGSLITKICDVSLMTDYIGLFQICFFSFNEAVSDDMNV